MIRIIFITGFLLWTLSSFSQEEKKLYDPGAVPERDLAVLAKQAQKESKHILVLAGGNWCARCLTFNRFCLSNPEIDSLLNADYLIYHLNYSEENKNKSVFAKLGYPQRFGFPVLLVLNEKGERIHTQEAEYLEQGAGYSKRRVLEFLLAWNRKAVQPVTYK
jgi:thiol:disulfide interchange protein